MFTENEKKILTDACMIYVQIAAQQMTPEQIPAMKTVIGKLIQKINTDDNGVPQARPEGISEDWFEHVCKACSQLNGTICMDKITEKFPGKCDPILKYEQQKLIDKKKNEES